MAFEFKKLADVEALTEVPENATMLVEVDGAIKRGPCGKVIYYWDGDSYVLTDANGVTISAEQGNREKFDVVIYKQSANEYFFPYACEYDAE
jgi:hypothetical protein